MTRPLAYYGARPVLGGASGVVGVSERNESHGAAVCSSEEVRTKRVCEVCTDIEE